MSKLSMKYSFNKLSLPEALPGFSNLTALEISSTVNGQSNSCMPSDTFSKLF